MLSNFQLSSLNTRIVVSHSLLPYTHARIYSNVQAEVPAVNWSATALGRLKRKKNPKPQQPLEVTQFLPLAIEDSRFVEANSPLGAQLEIINDINFVGSAGLPQGGGIK